MSTRRLVIGDLLEHGFQPSDSGTLLRKHYADFVIDALPDARGKFGRLELRGGSMAARIPAKVLTVRELATLLRVIDRGIA